VNYRSIAVAAFMRRPHLSSAKCGRGTHDGHLRPTGGVLSSSPRLLLTTAIALLPFALLVERLARQRAAFTRV